MKKLFALLFLVCLTGFLAAPYALANKVEPKTEFVSNDVVKATDVMVLNQMESVTSNQAVVDVGKQHKDLLFNEMNSAEKSNFIYMLPDNWQSEYEQVENSNPITKQEDNSIDRDRYK